VLLKNSASWPRITDSPAFWWMAMTWSRFWRAAQESIHRARNGTGPTLIECQTELASFDDPLGHMQHYMTKRGAWDDGWKEQVVDQINAEIEEALQPL